MIGEEVIAYYGDAGDGEELFEKSKLVRCKDCKWFVADKPLKLKGGTEVEDNYCSRPNQQSAFLKPTDFCSYGERIDNE